MTEYVAIPYMSDRLRTSFETPVVLAPVEETQQKNGKTWILWLAGAVGLLLAGGAAYSWWQRNKSNGNSSAKTQTAPSAEQQQAMQQAAQRQRQQQQMAMQQQQMAMQQQQMAMQQQKKAMQQQKEAAKKEAAEAAKVQHDPSSAIMGNKGAAGYGSGTVVSSKVSTIADVDHLGYFGEPEGPLPTPGQGMPASFMKGGEECSQWRTVPIAPLEDYARFQGTGAYDPDCDDSLVLPPTITLEQQRKSIQREAAIRPESGRFHGRHKNIGIPNSVWTMMNPCPDRVGAYKPSGNIAFGQSDSYWSAAASDNPSWFAGGLANQSQGQGFPFGPRDYIMREDAQLNTLRNPPVFPDVGAYSSTTSYSAPYEGGPVPTANTPMRVVGQMPQTAAPLTTQPASCYSGQLNGSLGREPASSNLGDEYW